MISDIDDENEVDIEVTVHKVTPYKIIQNFVRHFILIFHKIYVLWKVSESRL